MYNFSNFGVEYQTATLKNKSKIHLLKRKGAPIQIQACIQAGSRYNTTPGLAHFLEHMLVAGTSSYPTKLALATALEKVGGHFEAVTDADLVRLTVSVSQIKHVPLMLTILDEMLTASLYKEEVFKNEQAVVLREQKDRFRNASVMPMDTLLERVYPDFELRFQGLGTIKSVSELHVHDIVEFAATNITAERTSYVVSGDIEMNDIYSSLSEIKLPEGLGTPIPDLLAPANGEKVVCKNHDGENSDILIGFRCDTEKPEDLAGLLLIQQMFMGRGSRLIQELRYKRGLVYSGGVPFWDFTKTSVFGFRTSCATEKLTEVFDITLNIFKEIYLNGFSESECENLKIKIDSYYRFNLQTSKGWIDAEVSALRHNPVGSEAGNALNMLTYAEQIDAKTLTEIFRKYLDPRNAYCIIFGSPTKSTLEHLNQALL
ncbi:MAG: hypothetical protein RLZZ230_733 [Candidatus Parcubacteria bacterium]|jgi:zinc protease